MMLVQRVHVEIDGDFADSVAVWHTFLECVNGIVGVTVLATIKHDFPGGGVSGLVLIGESHAALHTWPELRRAYAELVTCGDTRALDVFKRRLRVLGNVVDA